MCPICDFILHVCAFPCLTPQDGKRYPKTPTTTPAPASPSHHQSWDAIEVAASRHPSCWGVHAPTVCRAPHLLLLHPSPAFYRWFVSHLGAYANLQSTTDIFPLTCLSPAKEMQGLQSWRVPVYTLSFTFTLQRLALKGRNDFAVMEGSGYACVCEEIQAPSQTPS